MKSVADIKRAMILGSKWQTHFYRGGRLCLIVDREVTKVASTYVKLDDSIFDFPTAMHVGFEGDSFTCYTDDGTPSVTYIRLT